MCFFMGRQTEIYQGNMIFILYKYYIPTIGECQTEREKIMSFYENLKTICEQKKRNVLSVITECNVANPILVGWKNGRMPDGDVIVKLSKHLDISSDRLLGIEKDICTFNIEKKAIKMAFIILNYQRKRSENGYYNQEYIEFETIAKHLMDLMCISRSGELHDLQNDLNIFNALMSACRKAVIDKFPLQNYYIAEIPVSGDITIIVFAENERYGKHEITFECSICKSIAEPQQYCLDEYGGTFIADCTNCYDAFYTEFPCK